MASWAEETFKTLQREQVDAEVTLAEHRLREAQQPYIWDDIRSWLRESCNELNEKAGRTILHFEVTIASTARVRRLDARGRVAATLEAKSDNEAARLRFTCGTARGEFIFEPPLQDSSVSIRDPHGRFCSPEEVGRKLLNLLMQLPS